MKAPIRIVVAGAAAVLLAAVASGCSSEEDRRALPPDDPPELPISYTVSGGYPPFSRQLEIAADGSATLRTTTGYERPPQRARFAVPPADLVAIRGELEAASLGELEAPELTCADCPLIVVAYAGEEFAADILTVPPELEAAFRRLDRLVEEGPEIA